MNAGSESIMISSPNGGGQEPPAEVRRGIGSLFAPAINVQGGISFVLRRRRE
jgi:hypothetical protein